MSRKFSLLCGASLLVLAACENSTGLPADLTQSEITQLAADMDAVSRLSPADYGLGASFSVNVGQRSSASVNAVPVNIDNQFTVTKQCPKGGQVVIAGRTIGTGDAATHNLALTTTATRTDAGCAFQTQHGVLTLNGNPDIDYEGHLNIVNSALSGLQTQTHKGSFTWARPGGSGSCDVDLSSSFDPATITATVTGSFCGIAVNVTRSITN